MERTGFIEIKVIGKRGNMKITPESYDIKDIMAVLQQAENLLFPGGKKERPTISYEIQDGSVKHILRTALQAVIGFNAILLSVQENNYSIDFLETQTAKAFEFFQDAAKKQGVRFEISTSLEKSVRLSVDQETKFLRSEEIWVDAEFYFYGTVQDAGGKSEANIHLDTNEYGLVKITTDKKLLGEYETNPLYKPYIIPNDNKLFAQAHAESEISHFATSDVECMKVYSLLKDKTTVNFEIMNIRESYSSVLGVLAFED